MQKKIVISISIFAVIGFLLIVIFSYASLSGSAKMNQMEDSKALLTLVVEKLDENDAEITELKESLSTEYLEKARAFSHMIKLNPEILESKSELLKIQEELGVDELHVTDEKGVLLWGTIDGYIGFDFNTSEQTLPFLQILEDPSYELAQEPTLNGAEQILFQYVGVSRQDKKGIVQVGILPSRLDEALVNNSIQNVVKSFGVGTNGFVYAISKEDGTFVAFPDESYIGQDAKEAGFYFTGNYKNIKYNGAEYYANQLETDEYILVSMMPISEMYAMRNTSMVVNSICFAIVFIALVCIISRIIRVGISNSIKRMVSTVEEITSGNMDARVNERKFQEFEILSDGINSMVENIGSKMSETNALMDTQKKLIEEVIDSTEAINAYTTTMKSNSESISMGASAQAASVEEITSSFDNLLVQVNENSKNAKQASQIAEESQTKLSEGVDLLQRMNEAMSEMDEASRSIGQVINTVSNIAFQTNILALNASVEAARAGEHGKGFSVVAQEVRNLAGKCGESAENTTELIQHALDTLAKGQQISDEVYESMTHILERTKESTGLIENISTAAAMQAVAVNEMSQGLNQISEVIQKNVVLAQEAEDTANRLFSEVDNLDRVITAK